MIDATCPVVLQLQRRIKQAYDEAASLPVRPLFIIYGKEGRTEVNGLVGRTDGEAIVIQSEEDLESVDLDRDILLYSRTTKSPEGFEGIVEAIKKRKTKGSFRYFDTICRQVSGRMSKIRSLPQPTKPWSSSAEAKAPTERCFSHSASKRTLAQCTSPTQPTSTSNGSAAYLQSASAEPQALPAGSRTG